MNTTEEGRVLVSTHNLKRAGELRTAFEEAGYTVDLVTPDEDVSGDLPIELLVVTGMARSQSALNLREQARSLSQAPSFAILDKPSSDPRFAEYYQEVFPVDIHANDLVFVARSVIERRRLQTLAGIVGETDAMKEVLERVVQFAPVSSTVLITGESGTGKELVARGIHHLSSRRHNSFIAVNVAALSDTLLESELFGHEKGSFTGAIDSRKGLFELADRGTVFLDEIGDMPLTTQTKLLRVLEQHEFHRLGGEDLIRVDIRLVTATNQDLKQLVATGRFRKDLFYRLNVLHIELPPLRRRREDIPLLVDKFITDAIRRHDRSFVGISPDAMGILVDYHWPGNIRELQNLVESMVVLAPGREVMPKDIPADVRGEAKAGSALVPVGLGSTEAVKPATEHGYRPELEFVFRTLVDLRMDIDDLRQEFDFYRDASPSIDSTVDSFTSDTGKVEIGIRQAGEEAEDDPWETREALEVKASGGSVVYRSGMTMDDMEREAITLALEEVKGNRRKAAQMLAIGERTLYRKIKKFRLDRRFK